MCPACRSARPWARDLTLHLPPQPRPCPGCPPSQPTPQGRAKLPRPSPPLPAESPKPRRSRAVNVVASPGRPDSCSQALRDIAEPGPQARARCPCPAQSPSQHGHHLCLHSEARSKGHGQKAYEPFPPQLPAAGEEQSENVHPQLAPSSAWEIPCLSGHLLFLPARQPGLASGNSFSNLPWGREGGCSVPHSGTGFRYTGAVPTGGLWPRPWSPGHRGRSEGGSSPPWDPQGARPRLGQSVGEDTASSCWVC